MWTDAVHQAGWTEQKDLEDMSETTCITIGFLLRKPTKRSPVYILASTIGTTKDGDVNGLIKIPKAWVKEVKGVNDGSKA